MVRETHFPGAFVRLSVYVGVHAKILWAFLDPKSEFPARNCHPHHLRLASDCVFPDMTVDMAN